jgi:PAS domain S-box-containing protein
MNSTREREFPHNADHLLLQGVTDYAIYMLDPAGRIVSWNTGGERIKGYTDAEVIGQHFSRFYPVEDVERGVPAESLAIAAREGRYETEGWRVRKDGSRFRANIVIDAIFHDGELLGFAKITKDITDRYQAAEHLREAERALAQAQKISAIGQLTLGIAHDFNNLLAVITTSLDLLPAANGPRRETLVDAARQAAERGTRLTRQMLAFARGQDLEPELHDVNALLRNAVELYRRAAGPITQCTLDLAEADTRVMVDAGQLEAALVNLVANARDAMTSPGTIRIGTRIVRPNPHLHPEAMSDHDYLHVSVSDDGPGMEEEVRLRAMEPFFTTKDVGRGSGLGLSQVFGFASQSGGFAFIESEPGRGTCVTIAIPLPGAAGG